MQAKDSEHVLLQHGRRALELQPIHCLSQMIGSQVSVDHGGLDIGVPHQHFYGIAK